MSDRLYLSLWLKGHSPLLIPRRFGVLLNAFPFSRLDPRGTATVRAISDSEPLADEVELEDVGRRDEAMERFSVAHAADTALEVEAHWDLMQFDGEDWKLQPSRVTLTAYSEGYERERGDHLRISFGRETPFVPQPESPVGFRAAETNVKSLLKLVNDLESALPIDRKLLWTDSGDNFAARIAALMSQ